MRRFWPALDIPYLLAAVICCLMGMASRYALNPDGVSYLDLAKAVQHGDWSHFIQGYWSPLYPLLLAIVQGVTEKSGQEFLPWVHSFDTLLVLATFGVIWFTARKSGNLVFGLSGLAVALFASGRIPRVEAVTPDVMLAFWLALIACILLAKRQFHFVTVGLLFGCAFLTKTSSWPWLAVLFVLSVLAARDRIERLRVLKIAAVAFALMVCWILPLSIASGSPTLGSSGRLNYCWYVDGCDSRLPDNHTGWHQNYSRLVLTGGDTVTIANFSDHAWTYQPWGDPTEWDRGIQGGYTFAGKTPWSVRFLKDLAPFFQYWTFGVWAVVLLPLFLVTMRRGMLRQLFTEERPAVLLIVIGKIGMLQFLAVHAEPRLIAPFLLVAGLGVVHWLSNIPPRTPGSQPPPKGKKKVVASTAQPSANAPIRKRAWVGVSIGVAAGLVLGWSTIGREFRFIIANGNHLASVRQDVAQFAPNAMANPRILLIGKTGTLMADAWQMRGTIVAQVIRPSLETMNQWPESQRQELLSHLASIDADLIWVTLPDGTLGMLGKK